MDTVSLAKVNRAFSQKKVSVEINAENAPAKKKMPLEQVLDKALKAYKERRK